MREVWVVDAVRTPIGRYGGALASGASRRSCCRRDPRAGGANRHRCCKDRRRLLWGGQPERRRQPQRRAHGRALGRPSGRSAGRDAKSVVRIEPSGHQLGSASDRVRRRRRSDRRRRRIDDARTLRAAQERRAVRPQARAVRHGARLAHDQSEDAERVDAFRSAKLPRRSRSSTEFRAKRKIALRSNRS